jgi:hypothetical protein
VLLAVRGLDIRSRTDVEEIYNAIDSRIAKVLHLTVMAFDIPKPAEK